MYDRPVGQGWRASRGRIQGLARPGSGLREGGRRDEVRVRVRACGQPKREDGCSRSHGCQGAARRVESDEGDRDRACLILGRPRPTAARRARYR